MTVSRLHTHMTIAQKDLKRMWVDLDAPYLRLSNNRVVHICYKALIMSVAALAATVTGVYLACEDLLSLFALSRPV